MTFFNFKLFSSVLAFTPAFHLSPSEMWDFFPLATFLSQTFNFYIPNLHCTHPLISSYYNIQYILSLTFSLY